MPDAAARARAVPAAVGVVVAAVVLAPLARPGTVLLHDMVFVPRQPWREAWLGVAASLPRAVPADAVVAAATAVVDGALLQRAVLAGSLVLAAVGAGRCVPAAGSLGRGAAALAYVWNPWVAERLLVGQWPLLVAHAALPWVVDAGLAVRRGERAGPRALLATAGASLAVTGGLLAVAALVAACGRTRRAVPVLAGAAVLQVPWLVPALLHPGGSGSDPAGVAAFALRAENWSGPVGAALSLGRAVPGSRGSALAPALTAALLLLVALGLPVLRRRWGRGADALLLLTAATTLLALAGTVGPGAAALRAAAEHLPGGGVLRDGHKWLLPLALVSALSAALAVERLWAARPRRGLAVLALVLPVAAVPDLALGVGGRLEPVPWPDDWTVVRAALADEPEPTVLSLPLDAYRRYSWNAGRPSLDPAPRWLDADVVVDDRLQVGATTVEGEDRRARTARAALAAGQPPDAGWVLVQHRTPGDVPAAALAGAERVFSGRDLSLYRLPGRPAPAGGTPPRAAVLAADALALSVLAGAAALAVRRRRGEH